MLRVAVLTRQISMRRTGELVTRILLRPRSASAESSDELRAKVRDLQMKLETLEKEKREAINFEVAKHDRIGKQKRRFWIAILLFFVGGNIALYPYLRESYEEALGAHFTPREMRGEWIGIVDGQVQGLEVRDSALVARDYTEANEAQGTSATPGRILTVKKVGKTPGKEGEPPVTVIRVRGEETDVKVEKRGEKLLVNGNEFTKV